jgi:hypothetical protein
VHDEHGGDRDEHDGDQSNRDPPGPTGSSGVPRPVRTTFAGAHQ